MKVLIFNPFGIGDVLFTTPLVRNLKEQIKECSITYICNRRVEPLMCRNAFVDEVIVFEKDEWRALGRCSKSRFFKEIFALHRRIARTRYDCLFDLSMNSQYGLFLALTGIKKRIGFNYKGRGRFLTDRFDLSRGYEGKHVSDHCLELLSVLDLDQKPYPFDLFFDPPGKEEKESFLAFHGLDPAKPLVAVIPGAGDSWNDTAYYKRWPGEYFERLLERLNGELNVSPVLFGASSESELCREISRSVSFEPVDLSGGLSLEEFVRALSLADLVIGNDGGPFHIAQALGKKTVALFGPVDETVYGAYCGGEHIRVLTAPVECRPCYRRFRFPGCPFDKKCLRDISVDTVFAAVRKLL